MPLHFVLRLVLRDGGQWLVQVVQLVLVLLPRLQREPQADAAVAQQEERRPQGHQQQPGERLLVRGREQVWVRGGVPAVQVVRDAVPADVAARDGPPRVDGLLLLDLAVLRVVRRGEGHDDLVAVQLDVQLGQCGAVQQLHAPQGPRQVLLHLFCRTTQACAQINVSLRSWRVCGSYEMCHGPAAGGGEKCGRRDWKKMRKNAEKMRKMREKMRHKMRFC